MARYHTCKSATRRWPVAVFFNIIDCACINAYIIYSEVTGQNLTRREFLLQIIKEMCGYRSAKSDLPPLPTMVKEVLVKLLENGSNANYNYVETSLALAATNA